MWARNGRWILPEMPDFHVAFRNLLHAVNLRHGTDGFTSPPKEGVLRIFSPWKIQRLWLGLNLRTWVPKASTLPLWLYIKNYRIVRTEWLIICMALQRLHILLEQDFTSLLTVMVWWGFGSSEYIHTWTGPWANSRHDKPWKILNKTCYKTPNIQLPDDRYKKKLHISRKLC